MIKEEIKVTPQLLVEDKELFDEGETMLIVDGSLNRLMGSCKLEKFLEKNDIMYVSDENGKELIFMYDRETKKWSPIQILKNINGNTTTYPNGKFTLLPGSVMKWKYDAEIVKIDFEGNVEFYDTAKKDFYHPAAINLGESSIPYQKLNMHKDKSGEYKTQYYVEQAHPQIIDKDKAARYAFFSATKEEYVYDVGIIDRMHQVDIIQENYTKSAGKRKRSRKRSLRKRRKTRNRRRSKR